MKMKKTLLVALVFAAGILLSVVLVRANRPREAPRTDSTAIPQTVSPEPSDWQVVKQWLERCGKGGKASIRLRVCQPGTILPADDLSQCAVPQDMRITITREGEQPAEIVVEQDGKRWQVSEEELDALPPDVRLYVTRPLGRMLREKTQCLDRVPDLQTLLGGNSRERLPTAARLEQRLQQMNRDLQRIMESVDGLRKGVNQQEGSVEH